MNTKELQDEPLVMEWLDAKNATDQTRRSYLQSMQFFTDFVGKSPTELIEEAETEIEAGLLMRKRKIQPYLIGFRTEQEKILEPTSVKTRLAAVKSFYNYYNIQLPVLPKSVRRAKPNMKRMEIPVKDEIREVLKHADVMERAFIIVGCCSGLSNIDIVNLKVHHFTRGYDTKTGVTTIHIVREKTKVEFYTFLTPEAGKAIQDYLNWRNNYGERTKVVSESGYLFIRKCVTDEYLRTHDEELRGLGEKAIIERYCALNKHAGTSTEKGEYNKIRSHAMRKFFNDTLAQNGCNQYQADIWMGHELGESKGSYIVPSPAKQKEIYIQYMHLLVIEKEFDPAQSIEFKNMQEENTKLAKIASKATVESSELQDLRAKVERLELERKDMIDAHWISVAENEQEKQFTEHDYEQKMLEQQQQIDELAALVHSLVKIDFDAPLTPAEKKAAKNSNW